MVALSLLAVPGAAQGPVATAGGGCAQGGPDCDGWTANRLPAFSGEGPVRLVLYAHFLDSIFRPSILNTPPILASEADLDAGFLMPTLTRPEVPVPTPCCTFRSNEFYAQLIPGMVEMKSGQWRLGTHAGVVPGNVAIAQPTAHLYVYLSARAGPSSADPFAPDSPSVMPIIGVRVSIQTDRQPTTSITGVIAFGNTGTNADGGVTIVQAGNGDAAYAFIGPLEFHIQRLAGLATSGSIDPYILTFEPFQFCHESGAAFTQSDWRLRTGVSFSPHLAFSVHRPLTTADLTFDAADRTFTWSVAGGFGSYDVDRQTPIVWLTRSDGATVELDVRAPAYRLMDHDGATKPVDIEAVLAGDLASGAHTLHGQVWNLQRTYRLDVERPLLVTPSGVNFIGAPTTLQGDVEAPGPT